VGDLNVFDKAWNQRAGSIIKNPHKLSEMELHRALQKIVEMPENKLKRLIISSQSKDKELREALLDNSFLVHLEERIPLFLT